MIKNFTILGLAAVMGSMVLGGCTEKSQQQYDQAGEAMGRAADKTGDAMATDAKVAGEHVENAAENAAEMTDNASTTMKVKNAIVAADDLDSTGINVDTKDDHVYLKGTVPTQAEKSRAQKIAEGVVGSNATVHNELQVRARD